MKNEFYFKMSRCLINYVMDKMKEENLFSVKAILFV